MILSVRPNRLSEYLGISGHIQDIILYLEGYADCLTGADREILRLRPGLTGPASLKYRDEEHLLAAQADPHKYNDEVVFPDKVRINRYYLQHYSFITDIKIIIATITGRRIEYGGEMI